MRIGDWIVLPTRNQLERNGSSTKLEPRTMDLLVYLAKTNDRVVSTEELLQGVWQGRVFDDGVVYKRINQLRKALGDDPQHATYIETIPKRGYRLIATVVRNDDAETTEPRAVGPVPPSLGAALPEDPASLAERSWMTPSRKRGLTLAASTLVGIAALIAFAPWQRGDAPTRLTVAGGFVNLTTELGDETEPSLSPDGTRIAYVRDTGDGRRIYVTEVGSAQRMPLTQSDQGDERSPRWHPFKPEIAFLRQQGPTTFDLVVVSAFGVEERTLTTLLRLPVMPDVIPLIAWAPDGRLLFTTVKDPAAEVPEYALSLMSPETGVIEPLGVAIGADNYDTSPALSPDGKRLAFVRMHANERGSRLMVQELAPGLKPRGAPQPVPGVPPIGLARSPTWSADGESLTFAINREIYEWNVGDTARVVYSTPLLPWGFDISWRDGRARAVIALSAANLDIWALPLDPDAHIAPGGLESAVPRIDSTAGERGPTFSPDGRSLAFTSLMSGSAELWRSDADGSARRRLTDLPGPIMSCAAWSPDSKRIALCEWQPDGSFLTYVIDVESGPPRPLADGFVNNWSADSEYLYAFRLGNPETALRVRVADGTTEELFHGGGAVETVEGADLLYVKANQWGVFARSLVGDLASNPERRLVDDYYPARGGIVPVAGGFYYVRHSEDAAPQSFGFYDYATQVAHDVAKAPKSIDVGMTVSPDGTELLFAAWGPGSDFNLSMLEFDVR